jgi:hypothetical protein
VPEPAAPQSAAPKSAAPQSAAPESPADDLPERRAPHESARESQELPRRGTSLPQRSESLAEAAESLPQRSASLSDGSESSSEGSESLPKRGAEHGGELPKHGGGLPQRGTDLPQRGTDLPQRGTDLPRRGGDLPQRGTDLPQRGGDLPQRGTDLPQRGETADGVGSLPRRTTRTRPSGRHRSPHRLSVASDAPALVLAVPGRAENDTSEIGSRVASIAGLSCPGVDIRVGYIEGDELLVSECLQPTDAEQEEDRFPSVIVPLLMSPNANIDAALRRMATEPAIPAVLASHLGPHPLVAEALHTRLADAGLARQARSTGLSISADGRGVVVLADVGEQAASAAGVAAVLLASRLSVPVVPASLGDPASIVDAVSRLTDSGAPRPALAPCLIGPETNISVLDDLSAALGAPCAPVLGAHQAIGQLVAIRYGAALASLSLAG